MRRQNIITMTSWHKRINQCVLTIFSLIKNTIVPDLIVLNLSIDEFVNQYKIPDELIHLSNAGLLTINWVKENTGVFKKVLPTVQLIENMGYDKYNLFSVDDDYIYAPEYIEYLTTHIVKSDAVTAYMHPVVIGNCMMYRSHVLKPARYLMEKLTPEIIKVGISDYFYQSYMNHMKFKIQPLDCRYLMTLFNPVFPNSGNNGKPGKYQKSRVDLAHQLIDAIKW